MLVKPVKANLMKNRFITTAAILLFMMPAVVSCSDNDEPDKPDVPDTSIQGEPRSITKEEFKEKVSSSKYFCSFRQNSLLKLFT